MDVDEDVDAGNLTGVVDADSLEAWPEQGLLASLMDDAEYPQDGEDFATEQWSGDSYELGASASPEPKQPKQPRSFDDRLREAFQNIAAEYSDGWGEEAEDYENSTDGHQQAKASSSTIGRAPKAGTTSLLVKPPAPPPRGPVGKAPGGPLGKLAGKPAGTPAGKPAGKPAGNPAGKPAGKVAGRPVGKPLEKPVGKPGIPARKASQASQAAHTTSSLASVPPKAVKTPTSLARVAPKAVSTPVSTTSSLSSVPPKAVSAEKHLEESKAAPAETHLEESKDEPEDPFQKAHARLLSSGISAAQREEISQFVSSNGLHEEVELGLRMLESTVLQQLLDDDRIVEEKPADRGELVLSMIAEVDPEAASLVKELRTMQDAQSEPAKAERTPPPARPPQRRAVANSDAAKQRHTRSNGARSRSRQRTSPARAGDEAGEEEIKDDLWKWASELDSSGAFLQYLPALRLQFSSADELVHALIEPPAGKRSVLSCVDPSLFAALGVETMAHKLALARGIAAIAKRQQ